MANWRKTLVLAERYGGTVNLRSRQQPPSQPLGLCISSGIAELCEFLSRATFSFGHLVHMHHLRSTV